ncbi:exopolyphosphatase [Geobacter sp. AOG1]|uniref:Ppx/GppA phosphatase family protein n=1 Tax=Geobacter sp. AOG1 TaxID=1566346 RepID=UPI001CC56914|nr:exopolyphosphatase [Geobacter sp. AOG1]GFE58568.1 exopolyphosphatase [Geobacter sp. AOG1]
MQHLLAAIDLGTNTARLLIGRLQPDGTVQPVYISRQITRLGGGFTRESGISNEARSRTLAALRDFATEMRRHDVQRSRAVATSAVRDAINGPDFCREVFDTTGIKLDVIDGEEEGRLTLRGVLAGIDERPASLFVFDVGGGSTEYTLSHGETALFTRSLPLGVVRLTEGKGESGAMTDKIDRELATLRGEMERRSLLDHLDKAVLVGTAGTATTLAAISMGMVDYDYRRVNNHVLTRAEISSIFQQLLPLSPAERLMVPGMEKGREDLIIAGCLLTLRTMELFCFDRMKVSDFGLLEGVLMSVHEQ